MDGSANTIVNMTLEKLCVVLSKTVVSRLGHFLIVDSGEGGLGLVANQVAQVGCCLLMLLSIFSLFSPHIVILFSNHNSLFLFQLFFHTTLHVLSAACCGDLGRTVGTVECSDGSTHNTSFEREQ